MCRVQGTMFGQQEFPQPGCAILHKREMRTILVVLHTYVHITSTSCASRGH